jgi:hypothetical protein
MAKTSRSVKTDAFRCHYTVSPGGLQGKIHDFSQIRTCISLFLPVK